MDSQVVVNAQRVSAYIRKHVHSFKEFFDKRRSMIQQNGVIWVPMQALFINADSYIKTISDADASVASSVSTTLMQAWPVIGLDAGFSIRCLAITKYDERENIHTRFRFYLEQNRTVIMEVYIACGELMDAITTYPVVVASRTKDTVTMALLTEQAMCL